MHIGQNLSRKILFGLLTIGQFGREVSLIDRHCTCTWSSVDTFSQHTSSLLGKYLEGPEMEGTDTSQGQGLREFLSGTVLGSLCSGEIGLGLEHDRIRVW